MRTYVQSKETLVCRYVLREKTFLEPQAIADFFLRFIELRFSQPETRSTR